MAASEELARRVVEAGRSCSLTTAVLEEWSRLGTPKQVEYLAGYLEAERSSREASKRATFAETAQGTRFACHRLHFRPLLYGNPIRRTKGEEKRRSRCVRRRRDHSHCLILYLTHW